MIGKRGLAAGLLLLLEGMVAGFGVLVHHDLVANYGNTDASTLDNWAGSFADDGGVSGLVLVLLLVLAMPAFLAARSRLAKVLALVMPVLMLVATLAVTPSALEDKRGWDDPAAMSS